MNKAIYLVGAPGSGKDFLLDSILGESISELSLDKLVKAIIKNTSIQEIDEHRSLIINGTAEDKHNVVLSKKILETLGYDTLMVYVYTSNEESKLRNDERIQSGHKTISESVRAKKYNTCITNMRLFSETFDKFYLFDNSKDFDSVSEEEKVQVTAWLKELDENIKQFLYSDINKLFEDTFKTDEADSDKNDDDDATDDDNNDERHDPPINKPKKKVRTGPTTNESIKLAGKKMHVFKKALSPESNYNDVRMGVVPSGGIGFTSVNAEGRTFADIRKGNRK